MCADSLTQVHKLDRVIVHLAGCIDGGRRLPDTFSLEAHALRFGLDFIMESIFVARIAPLFSCTEVNVSGCSRVIGFFVIRS